ncbi:MAG: sodium:proton antiporter [Gemmataceae bacterium]|nr:sodium:proton antiporter [Gemmataceae bacterium]
MLFAATSGDLLVTPWSVAPFVLLLLAIAVLPLVAEKWWHSNLRRAMISLGLAIPVAAYLGYLQWAERQPGLAVLEHSAIEYVDFIVLLAALYTVAGGIVVQGQFRPTPLVNVGVLAIGAVLANIIGTTGASILLIRPLLCINLVRQHRNHLPIFFIFIVSNLGGLLTPLGDPPLLLGFLNGVDFFWTLSMWPHWLVVNGSVLAITLIWDTLAYRREPDRTQFPPRHGSIVVGGKINILFLAGILAAVLMQSPMLAGEYLLHRPWPTVIMAGMAIGSWFATPRSVREHNHYSWGPIVEVAVLFAGIFVTMVPALALLTRHRDDLGVTEPWHYFWLTGILSSGLDNAPTYLAFTALAAGEGGLAELAARQPLILQAISAGAVFMGANTYIGNGPNFLVKSMAEDMGYAMPSFVGYMLYSSLILLPVFALATWLFFVT